MDAKIVAAYRKKAIVVLRELSGERLITALDFLEYLKQREEWEATREIIADTETMAAIREAEEDWRAGRRESFVPLEEVKRRVQNRLQQSGRQSP
ncbi:MAG: hypothetical protein HW403_318 [Dehalococcoidia bacterium]|nr:hypothetical protein [Dehalococcoidia bacterium]